MNSWTVLARKALRGALEIRRRIGVSRSEPVCVYDLAERLGVEVKFFGGNSFGGMYAKTSNSILVPTLRPPGRQAFTCAHELGHWYFGHGSRIDQLDMQGRERDLDFDVEERLADTFASYLLMPPWAAKEAFDRRKWSPSSCSTTQAYTIANQMGVGYETLVQHLRWSIQLISEAHTRELLKTKPVHIRRSILGNDQAKHLVLVDRSWTKLPVDLEVGDVAILPEEVVIEGRSVREVRRHKLGRIVEGKAPGIARAGLRDNTWAVFVRVCRREFAGRSIYRHLEDPDVDEDSSDDL